MKRTYSEILEFLFEQLPVFQRDGAAAYKPGLDTIQNFCAAIGNPETQFPTVHIAGTNGKGSSSHSIASILQEAGYKTGLYTSPHLVDFRERIRINGKMISKNEVVESVESWVDLIEKFKPSFFELTVALAFHHFSTNKVDIAVIEVGMGGRLDSTNILNPEVCLITNISLDHQKFLGNTIQAIAAEKAGIIKTNVPVVISESDFSTNSVFEEKAQMMGSKAIFASEIYQLKDFGILNKKREIEIHSTDNEYDTKMSLSLLGFYQLKNIKGILATISILKNKGWQIPLDAVAKGLSNVQFNTGLMGRWQILKNQPLVVADTGHNEAGIKEVVEQMVTWPAKNRWVIWGMVNDKDHESIIRLLPKDCIIFATEPSISRKLEKEKLNQIFIKLGYNSEVKNTVAEALQDALKKARPDDLILIGGSTFTVGDVPFHLFD